MLLSQQTAHIVTLPLTNHTSTSAHLLQHDLNICPPPLPPSLQGRVIPCDFIGIVRSQQSVYLKGEIVSNHDELMSNFFAQVGGGGEALQGCDGGYVKREIGCQGGKAQVLGGLCRL
jgi:hypothetical protein